MKSWRKFLLMIATIGVSSAALLTPAAFAGVYGSGSYSGCDYSNGCAGSSLPGSSSQPIDLSAYGTNQLDAYVFTGKTGQTIYFLWQDASGFKAKHSLTIVSITSKKVVLAIHSKTQSLTLGVQQQKLVDLNSDQQPDIGIMVNSISLPQATFRLWNIVQPKQFEKTAVAAPAPSQQNGSLNSLREFFAIGALLLTLLSFIGAHKE